MSNSAHRGTEVCALTSNVRTIKHKRSRTRTPVIKAHSVHIILEPHILEAPGTQIRHLLRYFADHNRDTYI